MKEEIGIHNSSIKFLKDEVLCHKYEKDLIEEEIQNRKEENEVLKRKCGINQKKLSEKEKKWLSIKCNYEKRIKVLSEILKAKSKQLVNYLNEEM